MTNEELQAKLAEAERDRDIWKKNFDKLKEDTNVLIGKMAQYICKTCNLYHFPEPVKKCAREEN